MYKLVETSHGIFSVTDEKGKNAGTYNLSNLITAVGKTIVDNKLKEFSGRDIKAFFEKLEKDHLKEVTEDLEDTARDVEDDEQDEIAVFSACGFYFKVTRTGSSINVYEDGRIKTRRINSLEEAIDFVTYLMIEDEGSYKDFKEKGLYVYDEKSCLTDGREFGLNNLADFYTKSFITQTVFRDKKGNLSFATFLDKKADDKLVERDWLTKGKGGFSDNGYIRTILKRKLNKNPFETVLQLDDLAYVKVEFNKEKKLIEYSFLEQG